MNKLRLFSRALSLSPVRATQGFRKGAMCLAFATSVVLAACGGGGGDGKTITATPAWANTAEGIWTGTASTGYSVALAVLENGETWGLYAAGNTIYGALYGSVQGSGNTLTGNGTDYDLYRRTTTPGTLSGSVVAKSSMNVRVSTGATINVAYSNYYDQPASLAALAGTYSGYGASGNASTQYVPLTIGSDGQVTSASSGGCSASGTASVRPGGKNIFNLSVTFFGSSCALGNGTTTTGIGILDTTVTPAKLFALALKADKSDGFIWVGNR